MTTATAPAPLASATPAVAPRAFSHNRNLEPNEVYLDIRGSREVHIEGILDHDGLLELEEKLKALKLLIPKKKAEPTPQIEGGDV